MSNDYFRIEDLKFRVAIYKDNIANTKEEIEQIKKEFLQTKMMLEKEILELKDKLKEIKDNIKELLRETPPEIDNNDQIQTLRNELDHYKEKLNIKVFLLFQKDIEEKQFLIV